MSELKATPGPWFIGGYGKIQADKMGGWDCIGVKGVALTNGQEAEANAHLIAAAPELYEALEAAMRFIDAHAADPDLTPKMVDAHLLLQQSNPHQALAKARGES